MLSLESTTLCWLCLVSVYTTVKFEILIRNAVFYSVATFLNSLKSTDKE